MSTCGLNLNLDLNLFRDYGMRSLLSSLGWILFLALALFFLLFYNLAYLPRAARVARQQNEVNMWIGQIQELNDSLSMARAQGDTAFSASFSFDELFGGASDLKLVPAAETLLQKCIPALQASPGGVEVIGYSSGPVPGAAGDRYANPCDYAAAAAGAVARRLSEWGVAADRIVVMSSLHQPRTAARSAVVSRVDIVVRKR